MMWIWIFTEGECSLDTKFKTAHKPLNAVGNDDDDDDDCDEKYGVMVRC
jgi:hypothetical protein